MFFDHTTLVFSVIVFLNAIILRNMPVTQGSVKKTPCSDNKKWYSITIFQYVRKIRFISCNKKTRKLSYINA